MRKVLAGLVLGAVCLAGCGDESFRAQPQSADPSALGSDEQVSAEPPASDFEEAPAVVVTYRETELTLEPWTTCWTGPSTSYCADGAPPPEPPDLGAVDGDISVDFPVAGWAFTAVLRNPKGHCGLSIATELDEVAANRWTMPMTGPAGAYEVDLSGRGPEGDVHVTFAMRTSVDGSMPAPTVDLGFAYVTDGQTNMYGLPTVQLTLLADARASATGSVVVVAADDRRTVVELQPVRAGCRIAGSLLLTAGGAAQAEEELDAAEEFGPEPYDITVTVELDGETHVGEVTFPADLEPQSGLLKPTLVPPLPTADAAAYAAFLDR